MTEAASASSNEGLRVAFVTVAIAAEARSISDRKLPFSTPSKLLMSEATNFVDRPVSSITVSRA